MTGERDLPEVLVGRPADHTRDRAWSRTRHAGYNQPEEPPYSRVPARGAEHQTGFEGERKEEQTFRNVESKERTRAYA